MAWASGALTLADAVQVIVHRSRYDELVSRLAEAARALKVGDPLDEVLALCRTHHERTNRRVFVEYVMLAGVNDNPAQAKLLARGGILGRHHQRGRANLEQARACATARHLLFHQALP